MFKNKVVWIIIAIVAILFFWVKGVYNNMVTQDEGVKTAWSQVENQYQRRMDLIPNLVNTVKGYAAHELSLIHIFARSSCIFSIRPAFERSLSHSFSGYIST